jgi:hypothetical protein
MLGGFTASDTVGLVVEYAPATGETRVRFPDGVVHLRMKRPFLLNQFSIGQPKSCRLDIVIIFFQTSLLFTELARSILQTVGFGRGRGTGPPRDLDTARSQTLGLTRTECGPQVTCSRVRGGTRGGYPVRQMKVKARETAPSESGPDRPPGSIRTGPGSAALLYMAPSLTSSQVGRAGRRWHSLQLTLRRGATCSRAGLPDSESTRRPIMASGSSAAALALARVRQLERAPARPGCEPRLPGPCTIVRVHAGLAAAQAACARVARAGG